MMNFFKAKTTWTNAEFIYFKVGIAAFYLLVGAYFQAWVRNYTTPLVIVFLLNIIVTIYLWLKKMKANNN
jgi:uncharacterized membrane protein